ncbi:uncharacterized protein LOC127362766 [Dicentrarchus labrax]|uniref:uncharacterized protein LOC127362766 n=1 Tax=Dicentrarchus labrax TaxID=13489 RepID=UPI0021F5C25F|nr:uncharacterized protein LOC127362766 [Dicentrarchus labrax]
MKMIFVVFVILVHVSQHTSGVEVYEGVESVLLPCQVSRIPEDLTVVWSRFDLNPTTIHQHQDKDELYVQNQHYSSRTTMSADALETGDFSLTLKKPRLFDSSKYTCSIHSGGYEVRRIKVQLQVKEPYTFPSEAWVLLVLLGVLVVALGLAVYLRYSVITVSKVEVEEGVKSVKLRYKTKTQLPEDVTVEWSCCAPVPRMVHVYKKGSDQKDQFNPGRTKIANPPKNGDLSLTLRDPCYRDSGTYICTVYTEQEILAQKVVQLRVKVQGKVVVEEWDEFVKLPFITTAELPKDATVEWRRTEPKAMMVHAYQKGQDRPEKQDEYYRDRTKMNNDPLKSKDLSVTLCQPGYSDRGTYICTVYKNGWILAKKVVLVCVKVSSVKPAKLPYQIAAHLLEDATVEWSRCDPKPMKVHVCQNGQDQPDKQDKLYINRTKMKREMLKTGDLSLTLSNPSYSDNGIYICTVYRDGHILARKVVLRQAKVHQEEVDEGTESVQMPFQSSVQLPDGARVEWSRCEPKPIKVHVYHNGQNLPEEQDKFYQGRTIVKENLLQTGDLSLTLSKPTDNDSDFYICTINVDGDIVWQNVVQLQVKVQTEVEVEEWSTSFTLPFKIVADLPKDATVEWRRSEPKAMMVHEYQKGHNKPDKQDEYYCDRTKMNNDPLQSKDLSLTLYKPGYSDRGTYICTVLRDGQIMAQKAVVVKVSTLKPANLPYQIAADLLENATVEWSRCDPKPMKVHVCQNGQDQPDKQDKLYSNRTKMNREMLKTGDLSLTLNNPRDSDSGIYICTVYRDSDILARKVVRHQAGVHQEEVDEGTESVQMHFQSSVQLPDGATVEWSRCEPKPIKVHVYHNGQNQPEEQDKFYQGRTKLKESLLLTGDFTLTLSKPTTRDSDYYICTVREDEDIIWQNVVELQVKARRWMRMKRRQDRDETDDIVNMPLMASPNV